MDCSFRDDVDVAGLESFLDPLGPLSTDRDLEVIEVRVEETDTAVGSLDAGSHVHAKPVQHTRAE
jgi:hypothetical protein